MGAGTNTAVLYRGPSLFTKAPIRCLITGLEHCDNTKTGDIPTTYYIREDMHPCDAMRTGGDDAICGNCSLRPYAGKSKFRCYVNQMIYCTFWRWRKFYRRIKATEVKPKNGVVRLGGGGDPTAIPFDATEPLLRLPHLGYTHMWRSCDERWKKNLMASVDTPQEFEEAHDLGWRTFRVLGPGDKPLKGEVICPNNLTGVQCKDCLLCDGKYTKDLRKSICNPVHGPSGGMRRGA